MNKETQDTPESSSDDIKEQIEQKTTVQQQPQSLLEANEPNGTVDTTHTTQASGGWFKSLKTKTLTSTTSLLTKGKQKAIEIQGNAQTWASQLDTDALKTKDFYIERFKHYREYSLEKIASSFNSTFEIDKTTADMVNAIKDKQPMVPSSASDIFEQCKKEALQRAISAFALAPIVHGLDAHSEAKYDNLSLDYKTFKEQNNLHDHENFARKNNERYAARQNGATLEDGYHRDSPLIPFDADIEHIVPKKEIYGNFLLRVATTDGEIVGIMNDPSNLTFTNESVNRSKGSKDLLDYIETAGTPVLGDDALLALNISEQEYIVNKNDIQQAYGESKRTLAKRNLEAVGEVGMTVVGSGARIAVQQVVGLMVLETIDILVDEIKDMTLEGNFLSADSFKHSLIERKERIQTRLADRFEERQIMQRAKALGLESGVAGALSVIPQIIISLFTRMPAFILSMVREGTLSVVRCVRIFLDPSVDKYDSLKVVLTGTVAAVCGVYVANTISTAVKSIPLLNTFNKQVTEVLSAVFVTALSLSVVYFVDKNKTRLLFAIKRS